MTFVLDASVALSWHFDDQSNAEGLALYERATETGALVPSHWALEMSSALLVAVRTQRSSPAERDDFLRLLDQAQIEMDTLTHSRACRETLDLALEHDLSSYDAAYLELARRKRMPLATRDRKLAAAARNAGLKTIEP